MPSAMPSTTPIVGANVGTSTTTAARPTRLELTASAPIAIARGSPAATTDPNMSSRITAAASRPVASDPDRFASATCTARPPSAMSRPSRPAAPAAASIRDVSATGMSLGLTTSRYTRAASVRPSGATAPAVA